MQASNRIIINTLAQYIRTIINTLLSLYSSRLVLNILGVEDYGVYSLVAGVVSMLSFFTNSLVSSTQRFLSVQQGKSDISKLKEIFSNSLLLHIFLGFGITCVLAMLSPFLFDGFLNIPLGRENIAKSLYLFVITMVYISFIASPYRALLISRENIVYISFIDIIDGVLKVLLVLVLPFVHIDELLGYGLIMLCIQIFNLLSYLFYAHIKYVECVFPKIHYFNVNFVKEMFSFTGWVTYSSVCITLKMQGLSIVLNKIFGAAINAAYGIGSQISGLISFISSSFNNAIAPQLMAAEGAGNRERMWKLAEFESKYSFLLLAMIGIPSIFEMQRLLEIWLIDVPNYTQLFACMFLSTQIVDMLSTGLALANKAIGNIGYYTFITYTPKLLVLPLSWLSLKVGLPLWTLIIIMFSIEAICVFIRIWLFRKEYGFEAIGYCKRVIIQTIPSVIASVLTCCVICFLFDFNYRFLITYPLSILTFCLITYLYSLSETEKQRVNYLLFKLLNR